VFNNKKREGIYTIVCAVSIYVVETAKASIKDYEPSLPIISFGIVAYSFVGQPLSKRLYNWELGNWPDSHTKCINVYITIILVRNISPR